MAIDSTDLAAYANGQKYKYKDGPERTNFSDPDAAWGHRSAISTRKGGGFYGYKLHMAACSQTDLPLAYEVRPANEADMRVAPDVFDRLAERGLTPDTAAMDKGYDYENIHKTCEQHGALPVIAMRSNSWTKYPDCRHGSWEFAGADRKRGATKWRCPTGECKPASVWRKTSRRQPLIPRETKRYKALYRARSAVEREFGRLKHELALTPLRVRGLERVQLHADLCVLTRLTIALQ